MWIIYVEQEREIKGTNVGSFSEKLKKKNKKFQQIRRNLTFS